MKKSLMALFSFLTLFSCNNATKNEPASFVPKMTDAEISAGILTPEVMLKMKRVSGANLSPDKTKVLYSINVQDVENNKGYTNLFVTDLTDNTTVQLTNTNASHGNAMWVSNDKINFLSSRDGSQKLWTVNVDGTGLAPIAEIDKEISALSISPKGDKVWFTKQVKVEQTKEDMHPDMPKSNTKIYDDLMVRHWDYWLDGTYSHLFVADFDGKNITNAVDITEGEASDVPMAPYFSTSDIAWGNTGEKIAYSAKKLSGKEYALSTNSDIYIYDLKTGKTVNVTEGAVGYDRNPVFSNDDSLIAYTSMERFSNESDKERLMVLDFATGTKTYLTANFDYDASDINWADNSTIYFISPMKARYQICSANYVANKASDIKVLTSGTQDYTSLALGNGEFIATKTTLDRPTDIFKVSFDGVETAVTDANKEIYDVIKLGKVEERMVKTTDGKDMLTWVVYPPDFDPNKKYPTLLYCQGGPQSVVSQRWSYRWNLQVFASQGYIVVAPNRRGLPSFGQEWLDQISGDYSGQNIKDYLSAIDDVAKESYVDNDRLGCVGASYGGYSAYFLAGNHQKRFKAFISHCGMFNFESFYGSTEELWFPNNDLKGTYWSEDPVAKRSYANSPHKFVKNWDSPILILVGLKDYRIPYTESLQAHTAAQLMGVPSRLVVFEDEGHQVFKPQNAIVWHSEFFNFLDKYLKK
ncbi:MAG: S9 family peptidase [Rikenellaceae bacterium]